MVENGLQTIQLAALLHDIGELLQRGNFPGMDVSGKQPEVSAKFIIAFKDLFSRYADPEILRELMLRHYENTDYPPEFQIQNAPSELKSLCLLINQADNFSESERDDKTGPNSKILPLASVFARLQLDPQKPKPTPRYYKPVSLQSDSCFPKDFEEVNNDFKSKYDELLINFNAKFKSFMDEANLDYQVFLHKLTALLQEFTCTTPSNSIDEAPDISLFDHLKTTAAIAGAMYIYHQEKRNLADEQAIRNNNEEKFRLIVGDLSGIQNYIFAGFEYTAKGASKTLRARSFILSALSESISKMILEELGLSLVNNIMAAGGKFFILAANTDDCETKLNRLQTEIDAMLMTRFKGEISLNIGQVAFSGADFTFFQKVVENAGQVLRHRKNHPFERILINGQKWKEQDFIKPLGVVRETICHGCGKAYAAVNDDENMAICTDCKAERDLGRRLAKANYIYFYKQSTNETDKFHLVGNFYLEPTKEEIKGQTVIPWWVLRLNNTDLTGLSFPAGFRFVANHIPTKGEQSCAFEGIAKESKGRKLLGYLKADVDNLGLLFACGLQDELNDHDVSISRITTMSRMLDLFFAGYINKLLDDEYFNCYSVFSGGDDLFIIGPWQEIIDLAVQIQTDFTCFVNYNPNVTLSMGINVVKPRASIDRSAEKAEELLEKAKENPILESNDNRNQINVFDCNMKWDDFNNALGEAKTLARLKPNSSFLYRLWEYQEMYMLYRDKGEIEGLRYLSLLHYDLARNFKEKHPIRQWCENTMCKFTPQKNITMDNMKFILQYVINLQREE